LLVHPHHEEHHLQRELTANKPDRVNAYRHTSAHGEIHERRNESGTRSQIQSIIENVPSEFVH
jgi:hypothetical protein